jgi:hypothetical protein
MSPMPAARRALQNICELPSVVTRPMVLVIEAASGNRLCGRSYGGRDRWHEIVNVVAATRADVSDGYTGFDAAQARRARRDCRRIRATSEHGTPPSVPAM